MRATPILSGGQRVRPLRSCVRAVVRVRARVCVHVCARACMLAFVPCFSLGPSRPQPPRRGGGCVRAWVRACVGGCCGCVCGFARVGVRGCVCVLGGMVGPPPLRTHPSNSLCLCARRHAVAVPLWLAVPRGMLYSRTRTFEEATAHTRSHTGVQPASPSLQPLFRLWVTDLSLANFSLANVSLSLSLSLSLPSLWVASSLLWAANLRI